MSFKDKIDTLLTVNKLGVNSVFALEQRIGASTGSINKYYKKDEEPGLGIIKKIKNTFNLSDQAWEKGDFKGSENEVSVNSSDTMTDKLISTLERVVESKDIEISWLRKHIDDLTARTVLTVKEAG